MEVFLESVEVDLRNLSSEARKSDTLAGQLAGWLVNSEHPEVKVAAERAILKIRALARQPVSLEDVRGSKELLRPFLLACETKNTRLTVLALTSVQKLLANDVLSEDATLAVITTLQHVERSGDEAVKLKMLQIVLTLIQDTKCKSTDGFSSLLGVCFRILAHARNTDTVLSTAAATIRQVVAVVFEHVTIQTKGHEDDGITTNEAALLLLEDLCQLAAGTPAVWLQSPRVPQHFALELLDFIIVQNSEIFHELAEFESALRERVCHVLQELLNEAFHLDSEQSKMLSTLKFTFKVLVTLLSRYYRLIPGKISQIWHRLCTGASSSQHRWRQICCLQVLKNIVSDPDELYFLYQTFDVAKDFDILAISRVVDVSVELLNPKRRSYGGEEDKKFHLAMNLFFEDKASVPTSTIAAEDGHDEAIVCMLALDILLKIAHGIHILSEECHEAPNAMEDKEEDENRGEESKTVYDRHVSSAMLDRFWECFFSTFKCYLALPNVGETVILSVLKGYQDILQSSSAFQLLSAMEAFLNSLCSFSVPDGMHNNNPNQEVQTLSSLNLQAVRTLLNVVHQLGNNFGPLWTSVVNTLYTLDGLLQHHVTAHGSRQTESGIQSDLDVLEASLNQLFAGTSVLSTEAVVCLLSSLRDVSLKTLTATSSSSASGQEKYKRPSFCFQRMADVFLRNLERVHDLWGVFLAHVIEVINTCDAPKWLIAIDALDRAITGILEECLSKTNALDKEHGGDSGALENMLLVALESLLTDARNQEIRIGLLKITLHILQRTGETLSRGWDPILRLLQSVPQLNHDDHEVISTAFDSVELVINEHLAVLPSDVRSKCLRVVSAYAKQTSVMNVSLTSINLLWSAVDFFGKEVKPVVALPHASSARGRITKHPTSSDENALNAVPTENLLYLMNVLQQLSLDKRPEVRNSGIRSFFSALVSYGSKLSCEEWNGFLTDVMLPLLKSVYYISMTSSCDEAEAIELGKEKGKSVKMLMHYSRNTERKQWEETMVLALNGLSKILRLYLSLFLHLSSFQEVWDQISTICKSSMVQGTKDAAMAAIALVVQVSETFANGNSFPTQALSTLLKGMDDSIRKMTHPDSPTFAIVRLEMVKAVGQIAKSTVKILPESTRQTYLQWLQRFACRPANAEESSQIVPDVIPVTQKEALLAIPRLPHNAQDPFWNEVMSTLCSFLYPAGLKFGDPLSLPPVPVPELHSSKEPFAPLWMTHVIDGLEEIFSKKISTEIQMVVFPQLIASLTRCIASRYVEEDQVHILWVKAASLLRSVLDVGLASLPQDASLGHQWMRSWDTIASCFEAIYTGKYIKLVTSSTIEEQNAILFSSNASSELKLSVLDTLTEIIMSSSKNMPEKTLRKLVTLIDGTMSTHLEDMEGGSPGGNLAQSCLRKLFVLCSQTTDNAVAIITLPLFIERCKSILTNFCKAESSTESIQKFSLARVGEVVFALEMLSSLRVAPAVTESVLSTHPVLEKFSTPAPALRPSVSSGASGLRRNSGTFSGAHIRRPHLLMLYEALCECVLSRESNVRSLVAELLKSVGCDLALM